jgi:hypothetical protein
LKVERMRQRLRQQQSTTGLQSLLLAVGSAAVQIRSMQMLLQYMLNATGSIVTVLATQRCALQQELILHHNLCSSSSSSKWGCLLALMRAVLGKQKVMCSSMLSTRG